MKGNNKQEKNLGKQTAEILEDWLYPNVTIGPNGNSELPIRYYLR